MIAQVAQSVVVADNVMSLTGSTTWSGLSIGDYVNVVGLRNSTNGASLEYDGAYRVANMVTTVLTLEPIGFNIANISSTNCGGGVIKRTDLRISYAAVSSFLRERVEVAPSVVSNLSEAVGVAVLSTVAPTANSVAGTVAVDAAIGNPVTVGGRASNANIAAMSAAGDSVGWAMTMIGTGITKPFALPEADWTYAAATGGVTDTSDVVLKTAAGAGIKNYLTGLQYHNTAAVASEIVVKDGSTVIWRGHAPASMTVPITISFLTPLRSTANTALNAAMITTSTATRISAQGYAAP